MLEFRNTISERTNKPSTELSIQQKRQVEHLLNGTIIPQKGHTIFEIDRLSKSIKPALYKKESVVHLNDFAKENISLKLTIKPGCIYIPALNKRNALKKFEQNRDQKSYYTYKEQFEKIKLF